MDSFFLMDARPLVQDSPTMKLHELLDWVEISDKLKGLYKREATNGGGPEPYAALSMFKLMLLGQWHSLSDTQLEHALKVRLDFMVCSSTLFLAAQVRIVRPADSEQLSAGVLHLLCEEDCR